VTRLIAWADVHFDPAPNIIEAWKYAHPDGDVYVLRNNDPHCHICGEKHDGSGALSNNKSYFNFTQRGCTFKMMGATCGEKQYPEVGRIHLPREIRELLGDDSVPHATPVELAAGDLGIAAVYLRLFGADMKFIDAKGNAFMWNDDKRLWVESGPLFVRHHIAVTFQAEVKYHIAKSEMEMRDLNLERPWGEEAVARYAQLGETRSNMIKVAHRM
jgi:hypothetical protein